MLNRLSPVRVSKTLDTSIYWTRFGSQAALYCAPCSRVRVHRPLERGRRKQYMNRTALLHTHGKTLTATSVRLYCQLHVVVCGPFVDAYFSSSFIVCRCSSFLFHPFLLLQPLPPPSILFHPLHLHLFHLFSSLPPSDVHLYFTTTTRFDQADQTNKQIICNRRRENENFTWFPRRDLGSDAGRRVPAVGGYEGEVLRRRRGLDSTMQSYIHATAESNVWLCLWLAPVAGSGGGRSGGSEAATVEGCGCSGGGS